jgi:hypothetical protein
MPLAFQQKRKPTGVHSAFPDHRHDDCSGTLRLPTSEASLASKPHGDGNQATLEHMGRDVMSIAED